MSQSQQSFARPGVRYSQNITTLKTKFQNDAATAEKSAEVTVTFVRSGRLVTCEIPAFTIAIGGVAATKLESEQPLPANLGAASVRNLASIKDNDVFQGDPGFIEMDANIDVFKTIGVGIFTINAVAGIAKTTFSYLTDTVQL